MAGASKFRSNVVFVDGPKPALRVPLRGHVKVSASQIEDMVSRCTSASAPMWTITSELHARLNDGRISLDGLNDLVEATILDAKYEGSSAAIAARIHHVLRCMYSLLK